MQRYFDVVQTQLGAAIPNALVAVYIGGTTTLATLYSDNGVTATANPVVTNTDGEYAFYAANGTYTLVVTAVNYSTETKPGVVLFDPSDTGASDDVKFLPAGTNAVLRSVQSKLRETVSVKDFGAVGNGVADDTLAIQRALNYVNSIGGGGVFFPPGTYRKGDNPGSTLIMYSNTTMYGVGDTSIIFFDDKDTVPRSGNDFLLASNTSNIEFKDLKIQGTALIYRNETNAKQLFTGANINGLRMVNVTIEKVRYMATAFSECNGVYMAGNRLDYIVRDGLRCTNSFNVVIANNVLRRVSDDSVALHALDALPVPGSGFVVANNTFEECQGIKILGAKNVTVTGNVFRRTIRNPIDIFLPNVGVEGNTPQFSVSVTNNIVSDTFNGFGTQYAIGIFQAIARSDGGLATFPGINSVPYPYNYLQDLDSGSQVVIGQWGIKVSGNIISRTLPSNVLYSSYGYGLLFDRLAPNFESDPLMTETNFNIHGLFITAPVTNIQVSNNNISGTGVGFSGLVINTVGSANRQDVASMSIQNNTFFDCPGLGIQLDVLGSGVGAKQVVVQNNTFDLDPYFRAPSHNADNTWSSTGGVVGIRLTNTISWCAGGNVFKNCGNTGLYSPEVLDYSPNIVYSDFVGAGDNSGNKGVRLLPPAVTNLIIPIDGDPSSATFGQIANVVEIRTAAIPSSGRYVAGHRVQKATPTVAGSPGSQYTVAGWWRATTGNAHVLNTDWYEMRTLTGT